MSQKIYIAVNKSGKAFMFVNEPVRTSNGWMGDFYVNSVLYEQVCDIVKQSHMTYEYEPELLEFQITGLNE